MRLLKIGTLNIPQDRWEDALDVFDDIDVFCFDTEPEIKNPQIHYIKFRTDNNVNRFLLRIARHFSVNKKARIICVVSICIMRILNRKLLSNIRNRDYDFIHSSYNDFDESAFLTILLNPKKYTRVQKETRLYYSYFEEYAFKHASRIVLNDKLNQDFFENKYGSMIFNGKQIVLGLDEDVRTKRLNGIIEYSKKLSEQDCRLHAVILAGRVLSNPKDSRSGGRLYYIDLIKNMIDAGIIVHLHTAKVFPYEGKNPYEELQRESNSFFIEEKLDFANDTINAYKTLSRYDIGVCHAHLPDSQVTEFDKVNIPHRYYEYHLAHVVPFDLKGGNLLLEKKALENKALICNDYRDITLRKLENIVWDTPSFSNYIIKLYKANETIDQ